MKLVEQAIVFATHNITLTNHRALYWPAQQALLLADTHFGKSAHFRKSGIALPGQLGEKDLDRLAFLLTHYQPQKVIVVGDLLHAGLNQEVAQLQELTHRCPSIQFLLVRGNHDRLSEQAYHRIGFTVLPDGFEIDGITLQHGHEDNLAYQSISGHIHPGVKVQMDRHTTMRFPCFVVGNNQLILPAFSLFSGLDTKSCPGDAICYALYEDGLFAVHNKPACKAQ